MYFVAVFFQLSRCLRPLKRAIITKNRSNDLSMNSEGNQVLKGNWWKNRSNGHPFYSCRFYQTWAQFASSNNTEAPAHIFLAVKFSISVPICVGVLRDSDWPWEPAKWILHPLSNFRVQKISILKQAVVTNVNLKRVRPSIHLSVSPLHKLES